MPAPVAVQKYAKLSVKVLDVAWNAAPLITRVLIGLMFFAAGSGKLGNLEQATHNFTRMGIPAPGFNAAFIGTLETVGGLLLVVGLGTRIFAFLLSCTMAVALATAHLKQVKGALNLLPPAEGEGPSSALQIPSQLLDIGPVVFLLLLVWLLLSGPGKLSIDFFIRKWLGVDAPEGSGTASGTLAEK